MFRHISFPFAVLVAVATPASAQPAAPPAAPVAPAAPANCNSFYHGGQAPTLPGQTDQGRIFCHMIYSVAYSPVKLNPYWSAQHLTRADVVRGDSVFRIALSTFAPEPALTPAQQAADSEFDHNDWDKGHMAPANDAPDEASQRDTFMLSNAVPQHFKLNRFLWARLEASVHQLATDHGEVYIVTGPIFSATAALPPMGGRVPIPRYTYKAVYIPATRVAIGFIAENDATPVCKIVAVAEITRRSGVDPFPALPASVKAATPAFTLPRGTNVRRNGTRQRVALPDCSRSATLG